jgi:short-subunit dehydrogenase
MEQLRGNNALVTGGSGGIGRHIALALAREGMDLVVSGRREDALAAVVEEIRAAGGRAEAVPADLGDHTQVDRLIEGAEAALGPIDVLVNNAGQEITAAFTSYTREELTGMVDLNLTAPLLLTHTVVPGMLERGRGHVVFIASLAGKVGPAFNEPYAATKAGLIGLNQSLRSEYLQAPVGFSVVCPGFTAGEGMFQRMLDEGVKTSRLVGQTTVQRVAERVVTAIREDVPEVVESGAPIRPILALAQVAPRLVERVAPRFGVNEVFGSVAASRGRTG